MLINKIKSFCDERGITPYKLFVDASLAPGTAYKYYHDSRLIPRESTLEKLCNAYKLQPNAFIQWIEDNQ